MTRVSELLRDHVEYTIWATSRLLAGCSELTPEQLRQDFGTADKSVEGTLSHLMKTERSWLSRIEQGTEASSAQFEGEEQWSKLVPEWRRVHREWQNWAATLSPDSPDVVVEYLDLKGKRWVQPIWQILLHVVNHSTHHRGQVSGFLRALGKTPPPLDYITFVRQNKA